MSLILANWWLYILQRAYTSDWWGLVWFNLVKGVELAERIAPKPLSQRQIMTIPVSIIDIIWGAPPPRVPLAGTGV